MIRPVRLRLSRQAGFNLQAVSLAANGLPAVNVARPTMWGNYAAVRAGLNAGEAAAEEFRRWVEEGASNAWKGRAGIDLRDRNLACWCRLCPTHAAGKPLDLECPDCAPCHADVLGRIVCDALPSDTKGAAA